MIAWKAILKAYSGTLLGDKRENVSAPHVRKNDAQDWLDRLIEQNEQADKDIDYEHSLVFRISCPGKYAIKAKGDKPRPPAVVFGRNGRRLG